MLAVIGLDAWTDLVARRARLRGLNCKSPGNLIQRAVDGVKNLGRG